MPNETQKLIVLSALGLAGYLVVKCPCDTLVCCSKPAYFASVALAAGIPLFYMGLLPGLKG